MSDPPPAPSEPRLDAVAGDAAAADAPAAPAAPESAAATASAAGQGPVGGSAPEPPVAPVGTRTAAASPATDADGHVLVPLEAAAGSGVPGVQGEASTSALAAPVPNGTDTAAASAAAKTTTRSGTSAAQAVPEPVLPKLSYWQLYRYADASQLALMALATVAAMANGCVIPLMNLFISQMASVVTDWAADPSKYPGDALFHALIQNLIKLAALGVTALIAGFLQTYAWMVSAENQTRRIRERYFAAIIRQDMGYFDATSTGEIASRIASDINVMYDGMAEKVGNIIQFGTAFVVGMVLAFVTGWRLALVMFAAFPLPTLALREMWRRVDASLPLIQSSYSKAGATATQSFKLIPTVMAHNGQPLELSAYGAFLDEAYRVAKKIAITNAIGVGITTFFFYAARVPVFLAGGIWVLDGTMNTGDAVNTFLQISAGVMFLSNVLQWISSLSESTGAAARVFSIIERRPSIDTTAEGGIRDVNLGGDVEFKDVRFAYPTRPEVEILRGLSMRIPRGQNVAIVGPSGSGKSTVVQLLMRMYDPLHGSVEVDGTDLRAYNAAFLRQQISIVSQEPALFPFSVRENVSLGVPPGRPAPSDGEVRAALRAANAEEFVGKLPEGLDTVVYGGTSLSGGQKQRVAIARAVVGRPKLLLLDEATSALDTKAEKLVQEALHKIAKSQTTITIAHRLSTIRDCDCIYVLQDGRLVEKGSHDELMRKGDQGIYRSMVKMQDVEKGSAKKEDGEQEAGGKEDAESGSGSGETAAEEPAHEVKASPSSDRLQLKRAVTAEGRAFTIAPEALEAAAGEAAAKGEKEKAKTEEEPDAEAVRAAEAAALAGKTKLPTRRLVDLVRPWLNFLIIGIVGACIEGTLVPFESWLMGTNLAVYSAPDQFGGFQGVLLYSLLFLPLAFLAGIAKVLTFWGFGISGAKLAERLRYLGFESIVNEDMYFFDDEKNAPGVLSTRLMTDPDAVRRAAGTLLGSILAVMITMVVGFAIAFVYGWQLTLVMIGCAPLLFGASALEQKALHGFTTQVKKAYETSSQMASMILSNIRTVATLSQEPTFTQMYAASLEEPHRWRNKQAVVAAIGTGVFQALLLVVFIIVFSFCYYIIVNNIIPFTRVTVVLLNVLLSATAAGTVVTAARVISEASVASGAMFELIDGKPRISARPDSSGKSAPVAGHVVFKDVRFAFPRRPDVPVLKGIDAELKPGQKVAFVGPSGSGKSTIAKLLQRLYDPDSGSITVDGVELKDWKLHDLRAQIGVVGQEPALHDRTIRENISYGRPNATMAEIEQAARVAGAYDFVSRLPDGFETKVGESGISKLSGGQKQRIAIARACMMNPKILILDEATSALDSETEKVVTEALDAISADVTTLVVAHRLKTIANADLIYVLQDGMIAESGTYDELVARDDGIFKQMVLQQSLGEAAKDVK
ncbi:P-loop containing nucleoside triphosphate hydrolase protein [Hyaloraphidium curvatum]|nr:P-loop containing nucleoside triphosphate hydrolase protein [Hyaloraphidium curvatum]